jgi:hypothetical protein
MKSKSVNDERGSLHIILIIIATIAVIGSLGFVFWSNFLSKNRVVEHTVTPPSSKAFCLKDENITASKGVFCSEEIGIKLAIPSFLTGKLTKVDNYEIFQGGLDYNTRESAGHSERVYRASITGDDNFTLTIAQEPIRTGFVDVGYKLSSTYYDRETGDLTLVDSLGSYYDSTTDKYTPLGNTYSKGEVVPSFYVDNIRVFEGGLGDAGMVANTYFFVIGKKIVKISLHYSDYMGPVATDPTTIDADGVFEEFKNSIRNIKTIAR